MRRKTILYVSATILLLVTSVFLIIGKTDNKVDAIAEQESVNNNEVVRAVINREYPIYANFKELVNHADTIFKGKVESYEDKLIDTTAKWNLKELTMEERAAVSLNQNADDGTSPCRVFRVRVITDFKGNHEVGDIVEVKQTHGKKNGVDYSEAGEVLLETDKEYLLFLQDYEGTPSSIINPTQGLYVEENGEYVAPMQVDNSAIAVNEAELEAIEK
ncbi:hypothetical protein PWEIH_00160 [Listeria weihenstephanensis FSL R9-0317]|uniref:Uncharacterized protein n=1 Tax=Listeria weihenstephanensis TaxID=1006155 RepID=A0A1S7FSP9_9LIST|nr:hypothetical protein [Listeria weihenstephanensis]AQY50423.1 hypothetical protein UE46_04855 [Listeria weihenstephanensis]EUJ41434.1 hypothetical protein PWEIH_00160 [Listeria weihenstephanensis FSL R9-0317]